MTTPSANAGGRHPWWRWRLALAFHRHQLAHYAWKVMVAEDIGDHLARDEALVSLNLQATRLARLTLTEP